MTCPRVLSKLRQRGSLWLQIIHMCVMSHKLTCLQAALLLKWHVAPLKTHFHHCFSKESGCAWTHGKNSNLGVRKEKNNHKMVQKKKAKTANKIKELKFVADKFFD